ncbi:MULTISPECIES: large conductance mechanosensitive channel protein MscL [unclassified Romboutsia]|uniref:large conductance mechanosensitive channel protein MscL n=1 Tax=unclassified Romboutsia TaxID=2626894 RepID=UPI0008213B55|nr:MULTISPECIES: large conductance mechanosensitive channel protein MscL [unclassified Romboutsia]SCH45882.1 Large-conductance mechanosensitive channel [uncultured Clostridium sp.]
MSEFLVEFRNFITKGKVIDFALGVIIGNTFSKVISSVVSDLVMPIISIFFKISDYKDYTIPIGNGGASIAIGSFIDNLMNLLLITIILFLFVKMVNKIKKGDAISLNSEPSKPDDIALLEEIRDLLKNKIK